MDLSNRDIALLVWFGVLVAFVVVHRDIRGSVVGALRALQGKLAVLLAAYAIYVTVIVVIANRLGFWNSGLLKDTLAWFFIPGLALLFGFNKAYEGDGYYGRTLVRVIGLTAIVEFYVNVTAFPLWVELGLLPLIFLLTALSVVAGMKPETQLVKRFVDRATMIVGLLVLIGTALNVARDWDQLDKPELALSFVLPIWLTLLTLPFIFLFSLYANYEATFVRVDFASRDDQRARRRAKAALIASYNFKNRELRRFSGRGPEDLVKANSWSEARRIIDFYRAQARVEAAEENLEAMRLIRYTGVGGTDWDGRPLDQREFVETNEALDRLAMFQRSQFEQHGRYNSHLEVGILVARKLPPEHGIVLKVNKKGSGWFAWRRTVADWCLGIGAGGPPPDLWTYVAPEPPDDFPNDDARWHRRPFDAR